MISLNTVLYYMLYYMHYILYYMHYILYYMHYILHDMYYILYYAIQHTIRLHIMIIFGTEY